MPGTYSNDDEELRGRDDRDDDLAREADDREHSVAHRPNPLPAREEDEEDLARADILQELQLEDLDDEDDDDLFRRG